MTRKFVWLSVVLSALLFCGVAFAQEDDDVEADWVTFTAPDALEAGTEYTFTFEVFNKSEEGSDVGIQQVDIVLPGEDYNLMEDGQPEPPDCINEQCDYWGVFVDTENKQISWQSYGMTSTAAFGDIREQDVQTFSFVATTDADATDGFNWSLWGEDSALVAEGVWNFGADDDDDDTFEPDDDDVDGGDDDDDDGCGC